MKIVSASRRTDIPAFYTPWLMNRLREGFARVPNPFNPRQIATVGLRPEEVGALVFWTRDPRPLLPHLDELDGRGYRYFFHVTLTGLPTQLEPGVPPAAEVLAAVRTLSRRLGPERIVWRFDPVILPPLVSAEATLNAFTRLAAELRGETGRVVISFARPYTRVRARLRRHHMELPDLTGLPPAAARERTAPLAASLARMAGENGMEIYACAERIDLTACGIRPARCIDAGLLLHAFGLALPAGKDRGQRPDCGCLPSVDIGIYGTCRHGCLYCYAGGDRALAGGAVHDQRSPLLLGSGRLPGEGDELAE